MMRSSAVAFLIAGIWCVCGSDAFAAHSNGPKIRHYDQPLERIHGNCNVQCFDTLTANGDAGADKGAIREVFYESVADPDAEIRERLKEDIATLAFKTERGFNSSESDKQRARRLANELASYNPSPEPAACYYPESNRANFDGDSPGLDGLWTLVYTDAPDITSLAHNNFAILGRIGQECNPPYIRNVIEWSRPPWIDLLPFSGSEQSRVLQKVVTKANASPDRPCVVNLKLSGIEIVTDSFDGSKLLQSLEMKGIVPTFLNQNPLRLQGPLAAPFGEFEILYLDNELRIVRTGQGYLAINRRMSPDKSWI